MARPGGNPDLDRFQFEKKYDWDAPCTALVSLRLPPTMKAAIEEGKAKGWQEVARKAIADVIEKSAAQEEGGKN